MENKDVNASQWLTDCLCRLQANEWQPNLTHGLLRFRAGRRKMQARERRMICLAIGTMAITLTLLLFPATRILAQRYVSACAKLLALGSFSDSAAYLAYKNADYRVPAPPVALTDVTGVPIKIRDLQGKVILLTFWTSNCATCDTEISWFREFQQTYASGGLIFLQHKVVRGRDDHVARLFGGLNAIPTTFLIDRSGRIAVTHGGFCTKGEFDTAIKALLNEPSR